ncbi:MAG TPA: alpha-hydroxy acid oxidase [Jatrophihabitans sp.]|uniref:alpha-hydroxy acid oxidase n=1 Tax=Jatrophihabitans sp. TaxID=1932789 RepID=UPI002DF9FA66|nr:alpha-hydroxy acid oxidase [Jatrophihabitans sp.]
MTAPRTPRRVPRWSDFAPLVSFEKPDPSPTRRRLAKAFTIADLRTVARRRSPRSVFDYTDGAAGDEISLGRARSLFDDLVLNPSVLRDVSIVDTSTMILGARSEQPFAFAPTGFTRLMHHEGERAVARVAERHGLPYALSTMGTTSIEDVAAAAPKARKWFQLYVWRDRAAAEDLVRRAQAAGFEALVLTVDVPVAGPRLRDVRNGFAIPPKLTARTVGNAALHPAWWVNLLTTDPLTFASLTNWDSTVAEMIDTLFDPTMTVDDLDWLRSVWSGPLVVKGIQTVDDAQRVVAAGADAVILSNHGGRQLDRAPVPLRLLPDVVQAVQGRAEVWLDTGIMSGADIVAAIALGADAALVGRAYLYGLMAGGERGVERAAEILIGEVRRTMQLLGVASIAELGPHHVTLP